MSISKAIIIGNLGKDPEVRQANGATLVRFSVATTRKAFTTKNGTQVPEKTNWHNIFVRGDLALVCAQYLHTGDKVYIEGELNYEQYTNKQGQVVPYTEIVADKIDFLTPKNQYGQSQQDPHGQYQQPAQPQYQPAPVQGVFGQPAQVSQAQPQQMFDANGNPITPAPWERQ